jgi:sugar diacid utilization regulator
MDARTMLRLLLDEAPASAFEDEVHRARAAGLEGDALEEVQEASNLALRLRLLLRERRRRETELAALYATAGDLTSIRAPQRVLQAIAGRARQLLDADTAYLTLIDDERGDTYMRVTDGMVTPEFGQLRLPLGVGLGGLVAQTATPYATSDYLADDRFRHAGTIDEAVHGEDLRAILGVPLKLGDRVIGVLFAANRHTRPFSPDEVNLLASLAAHAAIAIENARLFERAHRTLEELNATNALVRAHSEAVERAAAVHERLTNVVLQGGSLDDVAAAVAEVLGGQVVVVDPRDRRLAGALDDDADGERAAAVTAALAEGRTVRYGGGWATPVGAGADPLGVLVLAVRGELDDADLRTFERAAQVTALLLLNQRALAEAELRVRGELLDDLLVRADRDLEATARRTRVLGLDLDAPHRVLVASAAGVARRALLAAAGRSVEVRGGLTGERHGTVVVLVPATAEEPAELVRRDLAGPVGVAVTCGVGEASSLTELRDAYEEADRCHRALLALDRVGEVACAADLGVFALLFNRLGRADLDRFVATTIGPLVTHDAAKGTDLVGTLEAYFDAGGNVRRAAARLHVHVNTFYQRSERIAQLTSPSWQAPDEALRLQLALKIRRLRDAL